MRKFLTKVFGDPGAKQLKKLQPLVVAINESEAGIKKLTDKQLTAKTKEFQDRLEKGESLDALLSEAFAVVRETARRILGQRHFDVQLTGGIVMHQGNIAEMRTGEGKTLVATLPLYLNALTGRGVHLVTVNDYLARIGAGWMAPVYHSLGLSTGIIISGNQALLYDPDYRDETHGDERLRQLRPVAKAEAYKADILYGTNNEFGFDYLRDNMAPSASAKVQRGLHYAIVDEVDSILIDEARTPLIISAPAAKSSDTYQQFAGIARALKPGEHYSVDEKRREVALSDAGVDQVEKLLGVDNLYDTGRVEAIFHLEQALKAESLFKRDKNYVVRDGEVIIVDEFTGRLLAGRRYSEGLHQAIEAKEGVNVLSESLTLATISFQNYFRLYDKLAGMTGTAKTEEEEFQNIYDLDVVEVPTNQPMVRDDRADRIYKTEIAKFKAIAEEVKARHEAGQPVLIGTVSIEKNEALSQLLAHAKVPHQLLNAKNNEGEAEVVASAGQPGAVTLATNIAGRGTDIVLGKGVVELGGLFVLGSERHESRRIDNQLRGRAGRQGDPGSTQFYVSLEDDLMRVFGGERIAGLMNSLGVDEQTPIESRMVSKALESAQKRVESHNYDLRKNVLQYDDVMNRHRQAIYKRRAEILAEAPLKDDILQMIEAEIKHLQVTHTSAETDELDRKNFFKRLKALLPLETKKFNKAGDNQLTEKIMTEAQEIYNAREKQFGPQIMRALERAVYLQVLDRNWMEHLETMDHLRQGIHLRSIGQRDPLVEYKKEAHHLFNRLISGIEHEVAATVLRTVPRLQAAANREEMATETELTRAAENAEALAPDESGKPVRRTGTVRSTAVKAGRNDPCPCGSGLKYKKCGLINSPQHQAPGGGKA